MAASSRGSSVTRRRRLDADARAQDVRARDRGLELAPVRALVVGELRAAQLQLGVDPCRDRELERGEHRLVALPARSATEREQAQRRGRVAGLGRREQRDVDRVADPPHLRRVEREGTPVDAEDDVREPSRQPQRPSRVPVRVPEGEPHAERLR